MKFMTKEWVKDIEFHDLILMLTPNTDKKIPFVFTNGETEWVAKEDLYTVKTNLNVTDKENEIKFVMLPDTFDLESDYSGNGKVINEKTCKNDFLFQYLNRLRVISYIPEDILKRVKDKRMLALGYAEEETKKEILDYITGRYVKALELLEKCDADSVNAGKGLTIHEQIKQHPYIKSLPFLLDHAIITKAEKVKDKMFLMLNDRVAVIFSGMEIIEEETDIKNSCVYEIELYKKESNYELHFLIMKRDENFIADYYYVTYAFKDLKLKY